MWHQISKIVPGLLLSLVISAVSTAVAQYLGTAVLGFTRSPVSAVMAAVLLGMAIGNSALYQPRFKAGVSFSVKKLLRLGIILIGIRLSVAEAARYGGAGLPVIAVSIIGAIVVTALVARALQLSPRLGTLIAVGTSICGVSAIAATGPAIGAQEDEISYAVAVITVFGVLATLLYPVIAQVLFAGGEAQAGVFLGTAIHDTAQVTGAALVYEQIYSATTVLNVATVTKLVRNLLMVVVIPALAYAHARRNAALANLPWHAMVPLFVLGFIATAVLRSLGDVGGDTAFGLIPRAQWEALHGSVAWVGQLCIGTALAAVGLNTNVASIRRLGVAPFVAGLGAATTVGLLSYLAIRVWL